MAGEQLGWGIVGLGRIADEAIAPAIVTASNGRLVACCSRDRQRAEAFARRHGAARAYDDYARLLADRDVGAVFVATPNALHPEQTIAAARAGKHVLCEKPLALTVSDADAMIEACRGAGVMLGIGLHMRFEPIYQELRALVQRGVLGHLIEVTLQRGTPVGHVPPDPTYWRRQRALAGLGTLYDVGPHAFDLVRWIVGAELRRVATFVQPAWPTGLVDDASVTTLELDNGAIATVRLLRDLARPSNAFGFYGDGGSIVTGPLRGVQQHRLTVQTAAGDDERVIPVVNAYRSEIEHFPRQIAGDWGLAATPADARRQVQLSEAIVASLEHGAVVDVPA
ncbi:MAG: Gfo/Idh/MocA family oxidoreductase [Chloroflexi bacterium]|nr:Gfo/Idh/MocA family oxidoreductase [Chloroflexota bacterium]